MIKKKLVLGAFVAGLLLVLGQAAWAGDAELWSVDTFSFPAADKVRINIIPELRIRGNADGFYYLQTYIGPNFVLNKNFEANIYYALKYQKNSGSWSSDNMGYLDGLFKLDWFTDRLRLENNMTTGIAKLRNNFQFKSAGWFAGDEMFYNINQGYVDEGRTSAGYTFKLRKEFDLTLGYLLRRQRTNSVADWSMTNVLMVNSSTKF